MSLGKEQHGHGRHRSGVYAALLLISQATMHGISYKTQLLSTYLCRLPDIFAIVNSGAQIGLSFLFTEFCRMHETNKGNLVSHYSDSKQVKLQCTDLVNLTH